MSYLIYIYIYILCIYKMNTLKIVVLFVIKLLLFILKNNSFICFKIMLFILTYQHQQFSSKN